jgi:hypothetical protein
LQSLARESSLVGDDLAKSFGLIRKHPPRDGLAKSRVEVEVDDQEHAVGFETTREGEGYGVHVWDVMIRLGTL